MTDQSMSDKEREIDEVLLKELALTHLVMPPRSPLEELLLKEQAAEDVDWDAERWEARIEGFRLAMEFIFQAGPGPLHVIGHVFALTRAVNPEMLGGLSREDVALICADGRNTAHSRIKRIYQGSGARPQKKRAAAADAK